jgi:hypothetical protein
VCRTERQADTSQRTGRVWCASSSVRVAPLASHAAGTLSVTACQARIASLGCSPVAVQRSNSRRPTTQTSTL